MRRNDRLGLSLAAIIACLCQASTAQQAPAGAASSVVPTAAEVRAVGLTAKGEGVPTLKEWTDLQTRVQMKEMREKLQAKPQVGSMPVSESIATGSPAVAPVAPVAPAVAAVPVAQSASAVRGRAPLAVAPKDTAPVVGKSPSFDEEWTARNLLASVRWVSTTTVGGVVRAEVLANGVSRTVAEGDEVVGWKVGVIKKGGVEMTRMVNRSSAFPGSIPHPVSIRADLVAAVDAPAASPIRPSGVPPTLAPRPPALPAGLGVPLSKPDSTSLVTPPPLAAR